MKIGQAQTNPRRGSVHEIIIETHYTKSFDTTGWLRIRLEDRPEQQTYLPEFVMVAKDSDSRLAEGNPDRVFFYILEGKHKNKMASLTKTNAEKCLVKTKRGDGAMLVAKTIFRKEEMSEIRKKVFKNERPLNQLWANLSFNGRSAQITLDSQIRYLEENHQSPYYNQTLESKPLPKGTYKILTPESAHPGAEFYADPTYGGDKNLKYFTVWFAIENPLTQNSNFVHVGNLSEGCVTIYQLDMWNQIYEYLISNRLSGSNGKYVGNITIE